MQGPERNGDINRSAEDIMRITANLDRRDPLTTNKSRVMDVKSHRIDIVVGLLAASAIVVAFIVAYFTFGAADIAR
jgi:hypothetical protein